METLRAGKWIPLEVLWSSEVLAVELREELKTLLSKERVDSTDVPPEELQRHCGSGEHQGLMAKMPVYPYADGEEALSTLDLRQNILILCGLQDPFNFGSILRSADLFGIKTIVVPDVGQAAVSSHVVRSSVGAVNYLDVVQVDDLTDYCGRLRRIGFKLFAATERGQVSPSAVDMKAGVALLIGNEGTGMSETLLDICDQQVAIPQTGHVGSLNAAVAAGILCYEMKRQQT